MLSLTIQIIKTIGSFKEMGEKRLSKKNVTMVTKMLHVYISVTVPDGPIATIIHRSELICILSFRTMTCGLWSMKVTIGHIYKFYEKHIFSVSF